MRGADLLQGLAGTGNAGVQSVKGTPFWMAPEVLQVRLRGLVVEHALRPFTRIVVGHKLVGHVLLAVNLSKVGIVWRPGWLVGRAGNLVVDLVIVYSPAAAYCVRTRNTPIHITETQLTTFREEGVREERQCTDTVCTTCCVESIIFFSGKALNGWMSRA